MKPHVVGGGGRRGRRWRMEERKEKGRGKREKGRRKIEGGERNEKRQEGI